jgi:pyruvate dehydrogenase E2 component (dihydrolipoamide acetyltransferase)
MPSLGADMDEGTLLEWLVAPGDTVHKGDVVAVVDTAKAAVEVESFVEGVIEQLLVEPGTTVPVGEALARLGGADGAAATPVVEAPPVEAPAVAAPGPVVPAVHSPLVRRDAERLGVDLASVVGTGPGGTITREDVERAGAPAPPPAPPPRTEPRRAPAAATEDGRVRATPQARRLATELGVDLAALAATTDHPVRAADVRAAAARPQEPAPAAPPPAPSRPAATAPRPAAAKPSATDAMRSTIAHLMARSKREIPHYYLSTTVDLAPALAWMQEQNREAPIEDRLVPAALMLKATALAVRAAPALNGYWVDDAFQPAPRVHLGIAISLRRGGLVAPALHDAPDLPLVELMRRMKDLVVRARAGRLRGSELTDATITVTNLGDQGVEAVQGVIYPPQVALVGFGKVVERPWAVDGLLGVRPVTTLTLAGDHRATDGFTGARLLADIDDRLHHPEEL